MIPQVAAPRGSLTVRLSKAERGAIERVAAMLGLQPTQFLRVAGLSAARRVVRSASIELSGDDGNVQIEKLTPDLPVEVTP